jgi:hypothetical protein
VPKNSRVLYGAGSSSSQPPFSETKAEPLTKTIKGLPFGSAVLVSRSGGIRPRIAGVYKVSCERLNGGVLSVEHRVTLERGGDVQGEKKRRSALPEIRSTCI